MKLPFTIQQFLEVFRKYNTSVFPTQVLLLLLGAFVIYACAKVSKSSGKAIAFILAFFWLWMGIVYHLAFFSVINKAAYIFGAVFILQGILLFIYALTVSPAFSFSKQISSVASASLLVYALIIYPLLGYISGHGYPHSPTFGVPCPTTIFTLAIFMIAQNKMPFYLLVIPLLWTVVGFSAAFTFGIYEDIGLIVAGLIFTILHFTKPKIWHVKNEAV